MRVITGEMRGTPLAALPGEDIVRPTSQRVKEAMFSTIQFEVDGRTALDAFAGSGQLGIEALSRGAAHCVFIEKDAKAAALLARNLERAKCTARARILPGDALQFLQRQGESFDLVFLDPPYGKGLLQEAIPLVANRLNPGGLLLCEAPTGEALPQQAGTTVLWRSYHHGKTTVHLFKKPSEGNDA
ncbi:MAG: 16S rRNA (guanine(966)-N(2))-methyltransferase RsmD [Oscillospiraceae bacterium]|nr:16S rRNA (guanine(966)-N(2))-methyltransferase RsmD [Oscillospiraceae bacterium]